tara:strand:+ start:13545 stop:14108 length:564 start_codon:yes stop_codon:yes gene_type:complete
MPKSLEISTVRQLRLFNAIETRSVFEAMLSMDGSLTAREVAEMVGMSAESAHYHLGKLLKLKIVEDRGRRESGARPERLYGLRYRHVELKRGKRSAAYIGEIIRGVRLMLRKAEREYEQGWKQHSEGNFRPRAVRSVAWLSKEDIQELKLLEEQMDRLMTRGDEAHRNGDTQGRERMAVTVTMAPIG